jgi:hypothetical protein
VSKIVNPNHFFDCDRGIIAAGPVVLVPVEADTGRAHFAHARAVLCREAGANNDWDSSHYSAVAQVLDPDTGEHLKWGKRLTSFTDYRAAVACWLDLMARMARMGRGYHEEAP